MPFNYCKTFENVEEKCCGEILSSLEREGGDPPPGSDPTSRAGARVPRQRGEEGKGTAALNQLLWGVLLHGSPSTPH